MEVASREMEIHRRVRQVGMTKQELDRAQVRARFHRCVAYWDYSRLVAKC